MDSKVKGRITGLLALLIRLNCAEATGGLLGASQVDSDLSADEDRHRNRYHRGRWTLLWVEKAYLSMGTTQNLLWFDTHRSYKVEAIGLEPPRSIVQTVLLCVSHPTIITFCTVDHCPRLHSETRSQRHPRSSENSFSTSTDGFHRHGASHHSVLRRSLERKCF